MKNNNHKYLTMFLLVGFIVGAFIGVLLWAFMHNIFSIPIGTGLGMFIGIVVGATIDYQKNNQQ